MRGRRSVEGRVAQASRQKVAGRRPRQAGRCASVRLLGASRCPRRAAGLGKPVVGSGPVAFERPFGRGGTRARGPALYSDAVWGRVPVQEGCP